MFKKSIALAALAVFSASPALAAFGDATSVDCHAGTLTATFADASTASYTDCVGALEGNITGNAANIAAVTALITSEFGISTEYGGLSNLADTPFTADPGAVTSGTLTFLAAQYGEFVLGLHGPYPGFQGGRFSLYEFDGGDVGILSIAFNTLGVSTNSRGAMQNLSHAALYNNTTPVPEPETYALMAFGLGALSLVARRRKA